MVRNVSRRQVSVACVNLATLRVSNHAAREEAATIAANWTCFSYGTGGDGNRAMMRAGKRRSTNSVLTSATLR